jgi:hypothetical protein
VCSSDLGAAKLVWINIASGRSVPLPETVHDLLHAPQPAGAAAAE